MISYQEEILFLNKNPKNHGVIENPDAHIEVKSSLCGEYIILDVNFEENNQMPVSDIKFSGECCALTKASASIMTSLLKTRPQCSYKSLYRLFMNFIEGQDCDEIPIELSIFKGLKDFPSRRACALLPWKALEETLN